MKVWISALIPASEAGDAYDGGVRLAASLSEEECYRDLGEWLVDLHADDYEDDGELEWMKLPWRTASVREIEDALNEARENDGPIRKWRVEEQEVG